MATGVLSRKRKPLDAATEVGPERAREVVRQRFQSELVAVRRLLQKAAALRVPRSEEPPAKKTKASPPPAIKQREKVTRAERERLKADLEKFASELPDHIMELLKKLSRAISGGEMEIDIYSVPDEAILELLQLLDEFVRGRSKANPSLQQHQDGKVVDEDEEDVDIVGGVSPLPIVPAPLQIDEEEDQYVDICGDASPVVMPNCLGIRGSPSSSGSCDSDSDSGSSSDSDESVDSPAPAEHVATPPRTKLIARAKESLEKQRKEARSRAREKARQEVLATERTAMPSDTIHPMVLKSLRIVEYDYDMAIPYSLLPRLGLFLKDDDDREQDHRQIFEEDLEEGEIRF